MYGGRAIDSFDRRVLTTYMDEYLGDFLFDTFQPFHFFRNREVDYRIPPGDVKDKFVGENRRPDLPPRLLGSLASQPSLGVGRALAGLAGSVWPILSLRAGCYFQSPFQRDAQLPGSGWKGTAATAGRSPAIGVLGWVGLGVAG